MAAKNKILVGMSGGVDSSVVAYLLKEQGYDITGVTMSIWDGEYKSTGKHACYGPDEKEEIEEARNVCKQLHIPYHVFDCSKEYKQIVLDYFSSEYLNGRTPNPCVRCNQLIKLELLPNMARQQGLTFDKFATGHYANIIFDENTQRYLLKKGVNEKKDQSYFLHRLSQKQLSMLMFPLGNYQKEDVKKIAKEIQLSMHDKVESQDFYCGDYKDLIHAEALEGDIIFKNGEVLGKHTGIWNFTLGQRKGLGIAYKEPLYVIRLDKKNNVVIVGTKEDLLERICIVTDLNWISIPALNDEKQIKIKIRSAQKENEAVIIPYNNNEVKVTFLSPQEAITPGQSAVFYDGDIVVGGGFIKEILS